MASLRRKPPAPDIAAESADPVADTIDIDPAPSPAPDVRTNAGPATMPTSALQEQLRALRESEALAQQYQHQAVAEQRRQNWFNGNQLAQQNVDALHELHEQALGSGLVDTSPAYFQFLDHELSRLQSHHPAPTHLVEEMQTRAEQTRPSEPPQPSRGPIVSAPVSRDHTSYGGNSQRRITLSAQQAEMAKLAGISEIEYAKQLLRLEEMKRNGDYAERR